MAHQILGLLAEVLDKPLVSIEILPGGLEEWASQSPGTHQGFPFVLVDGHLGIPQKVLYKLYMTAMDLYKKADQASIFSLTSIILLANPAHQTALHARKKLIKQRLLDPAKELGFIELFIRGSKDCAKQSIIWDHRRWIFRVQYERIGNVRAVLAPGFPGWGTSEEASCFPMIPLSIMEKECDLTRHACELYPRNYHAWTHWHWVMDVAWAVGGLDCGESVGYGPFVRSGVMRLREWIGRHVSDYSAVHQLCGFVVLDHGGGSQLAEGGSAALVDELREHALGLILLYPTHEALWLYLRNTLHLSAPDKASDTLNRLRSQGDVPLKMIEKYIVN